MAINSAIEWTDATWNPTTGCSIVSPGCTNCYAMKVADGLQRRFNSKKYSGLTKVVNGNAVWTGEVRLDEDALLQPLKWKKPKRIFVNSMSDLFHESLSDEAIDKVFAVMALCPQHAFQVLTKRAERMRAWVTQDRKRSAPVECIAELYVGNPEIAERWPFDQERAIGVGTRGWPLPNVWLGVSCERQQEADERIPHLLQTPAAVRFISAEPLLGPIVLKNIAPQSNTNGDEITWLDSLTGERRRRKQSPMFDPKAPAEIVVLERGPKLNWVIVGGESGPRARAMDPRWALWLRDSCEENGTPFFFKQWGEYAHPNQAVRANDGGLWQIQDMQRVGKKAAGRLLDGREHNEFPQRGL